VAPEHGKANQKPDGAPRFPMGLASPEQTPEPESMPAAGAGGISALFRVIRVIRVIFFRASQRF
jgi:hypothetical protein